MGFSRQEYWSGVPLPSPFKPPSLCYFVMEKSYCCCYSVSKSCLTICNPINYMQHMRLLCPLSPAAAAAKSLQSCPTLCDPMDCSLPGSSTHGIFQARVLEWGAIAFSLTISWSLFKLVSIKSVMPSNHLILCCPHLLLPSIFLSI